MANHYLLVVLVNLRPIGDHTLALNIAQMQHHRQYCVNLTQLLRRDSHGSQRGGYGLQRIFSSTVSSSAGSSASLNTSTSTSSSRGGERSDLVVAVAQDAELFRRGEVQVRLQLGIQGCNVTDRGEIY